MRILTGLTGGQSRSEGVLQRFRPSGFSSAGASGSYQNGTFTVTPGFQRNRAIDAIKTGFLERAGELRGLRSQVAPGFGRLSQIREQGLRSRIASIRDAGRASVGNVREELARRRLQGSSFQRAEMARVEGMVRQEVDMARADANQAAADAFIQEIGLSTELIGQEYESRLAAFTSVLDQLNMDTELAANMASNASALIADNIKAQAEARAAAESAAESFIDNIIGAFAPFGGGT